MNRVILGILCGIVFGLLDAAMVIFGKHPDKSLAMLLQAFFSRFAIGFLAANVSLRVRPAISGALVGLLRTSCKSTQLTSAANDSIG